MNGARPERDGPARAAERRRDQGRAPAPAGPPDTRTSLPEKQKDPRNTGDRRRPATTATTAKVVDQVGIEGGVSGAVACIRGPEAGLALSLAPGTYTIGRARENDLVLKDIAASRKHLRIDVDGRVARLVDLGSGNGTKVNGKRAGECELRHGDVIEIGASALVYSEPGRTATVEQDARRDDAQARVVAAADELARELSQKLRFEDNVDPAFDGHGARTRAIRTADAQAALDEVRREAPTAPVPGNGAGRRPQDRLWNETFTNMPLSAVVADDQRLQGTGVNREREPRRPSPSPFTMPPQTPAPTPPSRALGPVGTAVDDGDDGGQDPVVEELSHGQRRSFVTSVLVSAGVFVLVVVVAYGGWLMLGPSSPPAGAAATEDETAAGYVAAITRAQDAITRQDWASVREYTVVALQVRPNDPLALAYKTEADNKLAAAAVAPPAPVGEPPPVVPTPATVASEPLAPTPARIAAPAPVAAPSSPAPPPVVAPAPPPRPRSPPPPRPRSSGKKTISDDEARARFERAIDAFRSKDNETGCKLLSQIADRAAADSSWRGKAESLYMKRCGG